MRKNGCFRLIGIVLFVLISMGCPLSLIAQNDTNGISAGTPDPGNKKKQDEACTKNELNKCGIIGQEITNYLNNKGKDDVGKNAMKVMTCCPMEALVKLSQNINTYKKDDDKQNDEKIIPAAKLLHELSIKADESKILDADARKNYPIFESLKKNLISAYLQNDPDLQDPVHKAWNILFPKLNIYTEIEKKTPDVTYKTPYFFLHAGAMLLNPYAIVKDNITDEYMLKESGDADTRYFVEAMYRNRYAWIDKKPKLPKFALDYEMRLGIAGSDSDPSGAVVSGAGDAYMEFSVGYLVPTVNNLDRAVNEGVRWTFNAEGLVGFVTDKGAQDIHLYWGAGPVVAVGIPYDDDTKSDHHRRIEVIGGFYFGKTDIPQFADGTSSAIKSENGFPKFKSETSCIMRGGIHFPFKKNGFVTITGRFTKNMEKETIDPWNIAIGYTIPVEVITDSLNKLFNQ